MRTGILTVLKDFLQPLSRDSGMAECGGMAWAVPGAFLPSQENVTGEPSCDVK